MLQAFLPRLSSSLNSILATQAFCVHFLPSSHPQYYLPAVFKLWESFNSSIYDEQWLDLMERLAVKHLDPSVSDPAIVQELREMASERGEMVEPDGVRVEEMGRTDGGDDSSEEWRGLRKDVGIFTDDQWGFIMTKCLRAMGTLRCEAPRSCNTQRLSTTCYYRCSSRRRYESRSRGNSSCRFRCFRRLCHWSRLNDEATHREIRLFRHSHRVLYGS